MENSIKAWKKYKSDLYSDTSLTCIFSKRGSSTIELLIAFAIFILSISAVIIVVFGNQNASVDTQVNSDALYKAQTMLEGARALSRQDFASVVSIANAFEQSGATFYTKKLDVANIDAYVKQATSTITWTVGGQNYAVVLSTILTDPSNALGDDTCSQTLSGDWTHPKLLGSADVGANNGGTDVDVFNKKAYVTADAASAGKPDFYVVDVNNPNLTPLPTLGSVNTGPGLAAVAVAGGYAYVANESTVSQLQVITISNPNAPSVVASMKVTATGDTAVGRSIFYVNKRVYLGLTKSTGKELYVIDVSNPLAPIKQASYETNTQVNAIVVRGGIAYLAVPDDPSTPGVAEQMRALDVSHADTGTITQLSTFSPNLSTMSGESISLSKDGSTLYLGEGGANPTNKPEFFVLNVSNPSAITILQSKYIPTGNNITVDAISKRSNLAFLWTSDPNLGFQIWDLNNLGSGTPYGSLNTQQTATGGLDCEGNIIYTAQKSNKALQIIGSS